MKLFRDPFAGMTDGAAYSWTVDGMFHNDGADPPLEIVACEGRLELTFGTCHARLDPADASAEYELPRESGISEAYLVSRVILPVLRMTRGAVALHASCVEQNGEGTLFLAQSGAGKTTVAAALVAWHGARLMADDTTLVTSGGGAVSVLPSSRMFAMRHSLLDGEPCFYPLPEEASMKRCLGVKVQHTASEPVPAGRFVFLESGDSPLRPIDTETAFSLLLRQQFVFTDAPAEFRRHQFSACLALLDRVASFRCGFDGSSLARLRQSAEKLSS